MPYLIFLEIQSLVLSVIGAKEIVDSFDEVSHRIEKVFLVPNIILSLSESVLDEVNGRRYNSLSQKNLSNLYNFFMMLPSDIACKVWTMFMMGDNSKRIAEEWIKTIGFRDYLRKIYLVD